MNKYKNEIIRHYLETIDFGKSLHSLSEEQWRTPIEEGKWTVAEIIGHFHPWDKLVLEQRIPYFFSEKTMPKAPDSRAVNKLSAEAARNEEKEQTINKFINSRSALCLAVDEISDAYWEKLFTIGKTTLSIYDYFHGLAKHDNHHFKQITNRLQQPL